jgi:hypothetical protein
MKSRKINSENPQPNFPRPIRDNLGGAPTRKAPALERGSNDKVRIFAGFLTLLALCSVLLWLAVAVLHSAGALSWSLSAWQTVALAFLYLLWRSLDSFLFPRK